MTLLSRTACSRCSATSTITPSIGWLRRHAMVKVRPIPGLENARVSTRERAHSICTAIAGNTLTPIPDDTIWTRVGRLVARNADSCAA